MRPVPCEPWYQYFLRCNLLVKPVPPFEKEQMFPALHVPELDHCECPCLFFSLLFCVNLG